jgi:hypothetical protein
VPTHRVNHRRELDEAALGEAGCGGCPAACTQALTAAGGRRRHAACSDGTERARVSSRSLRWRVAASARCDHCKRHLIKELLEKKEKGEDERDVRVGGQGVDWTTAWHAHYGRTPLAVTRRTPDLCRRKPVQLGSLTSEARH